MPVPANARLERFIFDLFLSRAIKEFPDVTHYFDILNSMVIESNNPKIIFFSSRAPISEVFVGLSGI